MIESLTTLPKIQDLEMPEKPAPKTPFIPERDIPYSLWRRGIRELRGTYWHEKLAGYMAYVFPEKKDEIPLGNWDKVKKSIDFIKVYPEQYVGDILAAKEFFPDHLDDLRRLSMDDDFVKGMNRAAFDFSRGMDGFYNTQSLAKLKLFWPGHFSLKFVTDKVRPKRINPSKLAPQEAAQLRILLPQYFERRLKDRLNWEGFLKELEKTTDVYEAFRLAFYLKVLSAERIEFSEDDFTLVMPKASTEISQTPLSPTERSIA